MKIVHNLFIGPRCPWGPIYRSGSLSLTEPLCADLTDVTLADEDTNSILTDIANRAFQGNVAMQVTQPGGQLWNQAMQVTLPDNQILNQFATNHNAQIQWENL